MAEASGADVRSALPDDVECDEPEQLVTEVVRATDRGRTLDELFALPPAKVDELVARVEGASRYVTRDAPTARRIAEQVDFAEGTGGPGLETLRGLIQRDF